VLEEREEEALGFAALEVPPVVPVEGREEDDPVNDEEAREEEGAEDEEAEEAEEEEAEEEEATGEIQPVEPVALVYVPVEQRVHDVRFEEVLVEVLRGHSAH